MTPPRTGDRGVAPAPNAVVFEAFTDPWDLAKWWGPHGFRTTTHEIDIRVGATGGM